MLAGEPSGDRLGSELITGLVKLDPGIEIDGIGGPAMIAAGLTPKFPIDRLSVMGIVEIIPRLPELFRLRKEVVNTVLSGRYDGLLTIDSPDFCLGVARRVRKKNPDIMLVHYVSPSVWAWRPWRTRSIAASVHHVLTLFPFEQVYLERAGIPSTHTGHPIADVHQPTDREIERAREIAGLQPDGRLILLLPGSRGGEAERHVAMFASVARKLASIHDDVQFLVVMTPATVSTVLADRSAWPDGTGFLDTGRFEPETAERHKLALFRSAHAALAASGTVSLELAAMRTPMVIAYDMNLITRLVLGTMLTVDTVTLVNLVTGTRHIPEHLGCGLSADGLVQDMTRVIDDADTRRAQLDAFTETMAQLSVSGESVGDVTARRLLEVLSRNRQPAH